MSFWGGGGAVPPLPLHVPVPFGEVLLSQLSVPHQPSVRAKYDGARLHQILHFAPKNLTVLQRGASITPLLWGETQACRD